MLFLMVKCLSSLKTSLTVASVNSLLYVTTNYFKLCAIQMESKKSNLTYI